MKKSKRLSHLITQVAGVKNWGIFLILFFIATNMNATNYVVSGAGSSEVNGTYTEDGTYNGKPQYRLDSTDYYLRFAYGDLTPDRWEIGNGYMEWQTYYYTEVTGNTPPSTGWKVGSNGSSSVPTVLEAGSNLSYSSDAFFESLNNDGSIENTITITYLEPGTDYFTGSNGTFSASKYAASNVPPGLSMVITRNSNTELIVSLTGMATNHAHIYDVTNLGIVFNDAAFNDGDASAVNHSTKNDLEVNFREVINIASSGGDYSTIADGISNAESYDIINIASETFTGSGLAVSKSLVFQGQGAESSIIQADEDPGQASNRVFNIIGSGNSVTFINLTIRNGNYGSNGGGIYCEGGTLKIINSSVSNNSSSTSNRTYGGGIYMEEGVLEISNSTISNNSCTASNIAFGGGLYSGATTTISNSTFSGNTTVSTSYNTTLGGGICCKNNSCEITNSTISGNTCSGGAQWGDGLCFYNTTNTCSLTISNTIMAGNGTYDYYTYSNPVNITDNGYNIIENSIVAANDGGFNNTTSILYNTKYNQAGTSFSSWTKGGNTVSGTLNISSTLADNNTLNGTQTLELTSGSFAIDAGTGTDVDQRGAPVFGGTKDIGAYEYNTDWVVWDGSSSSDWSTGANWSSAPTSTSDIGVKRNCSNNPALATATTCNSMNIPEDASLIIEDNGSLTTTSDLNNEGTFTIQSNADGTGSLIVEGTATGNVIFQRYVDDIPAKGDSKWHYVSAPVEGQALDNSWMSSNTIAQTEGHYQFFRFDEDQNYWIIYGSEGSPEAFTDNTFVDARGYCLTRDGAGELSFTGTVRTDNVNYPTTYTTDNGEGCNLVGNPFTSSIGITSSATTTANFLDVNSNLLDDSYEAVYIWDEASGYTFGSQDYKTISNAVVGDRAKLPNNYIQPGQAFMVKVVSGGGNLAFNENMQAHATDAYYKEQKEIWPSMELIVENDELYNSTAIGFNENMTTGLDPSFDVGKMKGNPNIALYTRLVEDNGVDFAIQALSDNNIESYVIPVGVDVAQENIVQFSISQTNLDLDVYLEDRILNKSVNLSEQNYSANISNSGIGRFFLHFSPVGIEDQNQVESIQSYVNGQLLTIIGNTGNTQLEIVNMQGQVVVRENIHLNGRFSKTLNLKSGVYIVRANSSFNKVIISN